MPGFLFLFYFCLYLNGVFPKVFLNTFIKYEVSEKPDFIQLSVTVYPWSRSFFAYDILFAFKNSIGGI